MSYSLNYIVYITLSLTGTSKALAASHKPINRHDDRDNGIHNADIVHIGGENRLGVGEAIHDEGEEGPAKEDDVGKETNGAEPEGAVLDVVPAFNEECDDRDSVADVEEDNAGCDHAVDALTDCLR
jgi:hypothetical protein